MVTHGTPNMDLIIEGVKRYVKENIEYVDKTNGTAICDKVCKGVPTQSN